jgi:hypothetical protein
MLENNDMTRVGGSYARRPALCWALLGAALLLDPAQAGAQVTDPVPDIPLGSIRVELEVVAELPDSGSGSRPWARPMVVKGDGTGRTFICDQNGYIYQLHSDGSLSVFLDVANTFDTHLWVDLAQRGLSSFAFHPDYHDPAKPGYGKLYTSSATAANQGAADFPVPAGAPESHHSAIFEWTVGGDPDAIDPTSLRLLFKVGQTYKDHNMGDIGFDPHSQPGNPDHGMLYIAMGDGGNLSSPLPSVDPHFSGQSLDTLLGKILRIDPLEPAGGGAQYSVPIDNPYASDGDPNTFGEIWALGLRNPHRFSWDRGGAKQMLISDIGQSNIEEINIGAKAANYGWSEREGTFLVVHTNANDVFPLPGNDAGLGYTYPVVQYDHDQDDRAVSGGYVLRDAPHSELNEHYIFGDLRSGRVFHVPVSQLDGSGQANIEALVLVDAADGQVKTLREMITGGEPDYRADLRFGRDDAGTLYLVTKRDGRVRRLIPDQNLLELPSLRPASLWMLVLLFAAVAITPLLRRAASR